MTRAEDRLYVGGWIGTKKQDTGCWYDRIAAGLAASVEGESLEPRVRASRKVFDFTAQLGAAGWSGDGYELVNAGRIVVPEQQELALEADGAARALGARAGARRAQSADAAGAVTAVARRGAQRAARLQPARVRRAQALAARPADARAAAPPSRAAGGGSCRGRAPLPRPGRPWPGRGGDRVVGRRGAGRHRGARPPGAVRRRLARRGAADRLGADAARDLHRERPGRPPRRHGPRGADRRLQDQSAAAGRGRRRGARLSPPARALPRAAPRNLSITPCAGFSAVDGNAAADGDRCRNAR